MDYSKETSLPRPYTPTESNHTSSDKQPKFQLTRPDRKLPKWAVWVGVALLSILLGSGLYLVYCALTGAQPGASILNPSGSATTALTPTGAELKHSYGIAAGGSLGDLTDDQLDKRMAGIAASGAKWVRFDFNWAIIQPDNAKDYNWSVYDRLVQSAQKHKLYVLGILDFTPAWARSADCSDSDKCHPADNQKFADFAKTVASRYKDRGLHYWEIWNEPNSPDFWQPGANPAAYAKLLQATSKALRGVDSDAYIITAGLSPQDTTSDSYSPIDFLKGVYAAGAKDSFDAVADHPYTFPISPKASVFHAWNQMADPKSGLREIMVSNGDQAKKVWITEFGSPTGGPGPVSTIENPQLDQHPYVVDEELQAKILGDAIELYKSYNWVGPFMYYSYEDAGTTPDTNENFFGLLRHDGTQKPAYQTFKDAATSTSVDAQ